MNAQTQQKRNRNSPTMQRLRKAEADDTVSVDRLNLAEKAMSKAQVDLREAIYALAKSNLALEVAEAEWRQSRRRIGRAT